ncbi:tRNA-(ms[2]io[6]A)-hydroxylase [Allofrancisella guangzhouensis]|uniref:tRNA hydroxylase n=1 Tax=Allofrancisella guangzhouensis TaxID=594679 RepID=A0A0A8E4T8_9GAMM|nr:tRNA-(ms[2]io[6]A)-hydroxylase [Allofrancisella guangzhouensis]AJC49255.1 tRNA hydroxylase [Allofrancisella guangzhouensis]MBK2027697.1 tRNA-(ms[2]io[6]A)-hydroxylase [Allofrancisella guangzhouensis]MBK2044889.1 tRNA-(ms[2]io[6]A)-hydroxylase [Allofrancisella guangzhouensis]MBK2046414.1 tRNA-(ms[2]io[6]A)-hydroxylase [Allofrancisella guangzhouensis]
MSKQLYVNYDTIEKFLLCETPNAWINTALKNIELMLLDHAHCEIKAASSAMTYICRHPDKHDLVTRMSKIAREELVHFEQVMRILKKRDIKFKSISASRYASQLIRAARTDKEGRFIDDLIIGAYIEARSCERFAKIAPFLDNELQKFYNGLLESERRHFTIYLEFAQKYSSRDILKEIKRIGEVEKKLILSLDTEFRFHSGVLEV